MSAFGPRSEFDLVEDFWRSILALDEQRVARAARRVARRRTMRTLGFAVLALLAAAAVAMAARAILFGDAAPNELERAQISFGSLRPGSVQLMDLRVDDPVAGPPWGLRVFTTSKNLVCYQVGRVVDDRLVALGTAGAFDDDGIAHPLPLEGEGCGMQRGAATRFGAVSQVTNASGLIGTSGCLSPDDSHMLRLAVPDAVGVLARAVERGDVSAIADARQHLAAAYERQRTAPPACAIADERTILLGTTPAGTQSVSLVGPGTRVDEQTPQGMYLLVLNGANAADGTQIYAQSADGQRCTLPNPAGQPQANSGTSPEIPLCDSQGPD